jgi:hypothetical protein
MENKSEVSSMNQIEIYDPAMCCSTGVCGPGVDSELVRVSADVESLKKQGIEIKRFNLAQDLEAFASNEIVKLFLQQKGPDALPVTLLNGAILKESTYPTTSELSEWTGAQIGSVGVIRKPLKLIEFNSSSQNSCEPGSGCC